MDREPGFLQRVRETLPQLHPTERRLAEFLLNFPGELASYTAAELARLANVSAATVSRFVQKLGYANYEEARRHVRADQKTGAALYMVSSQPDGAEAVLHAHLTQAHANIDQSFLGITQAEVDALARAVIGSRQVWIVGFRTGHALAAYLHWQILQVCPHVNLIPQAGQTMAEHVARIAPEDCVILFGFARRVKVLPLLVGQIARTGARHALISDEGLERHESTTWHFRCRTVAPGPLFSHVAPLALVHLLATRVIELSGPEGRRRLSAVEALHDELDEL